MVLALIACGARTADGGTMNDSDSITKVLEEDTISFVEPLSSEQKSSVKALTWVVTVYDTVHSGKLSTLKDLYKDTPGQFTFRGNAMRNASFEGKVQGTPQRVRQEWVFITDSDDKPTSMGTWGGGSGWTGEPVYVEWPDTLMKRMQRESGALTDDFSQKEIMVGSLCEKVYFINYETGKASRTPLDAVNPIKGSISLDPSLNGNLYVGQGIPKVQPMGRMAFNLFTHKQTFFSGGDKTSYLKWQANDSSPVRVGQFLFWPSENGVIYKYLVTDNSITLHSTLKYKNKKRGAAGTENSICIYHNYGYFGNNHGDVLCIDLNTLTPIWHYDNHDDIDASLVCEVENGIPYLYCGSEASISSWLS